MKKMISAKHPPFSRRKITFKSLLCAALLAVIFVVASCGGVEPDDDSYAPPVEIPDSGDNAGNTGDGGNQGANEGSTGNGGNQGEQGNQGNQGDQGNQGGQGNENQDPDPDTPENPETATTQSILKDILGEDTYNSLSGKLSSNITLTAQTIVDVTDIFPVLEEAVNNSTKKDEVKKTLSAKGEDVKVALVAEVENKISIKRKPAEYEGFLENKGTNTYTPTTIYDGYGYEISANGNMNIILSGKFNYFYEHIESLKGNVDISKLEIYSDKLKGWDDDLKLLSSSLKKEIYDKFSLNNKTIDALPKLSFGLYNDDYDYGLKDFMEIYDKYNSSEKMKIKANFSNVEFDGSKLVSNSSGYTLFSNNTAKTSNDSSIKSITADELVKLSNKYGIHKIKNIIVSGNSSANSVNWTDLTNVIFEGDMSKLTINNIIYLNGIVYFKDLAYENDNNFNFVKGSLKLDKMSSAMDINGLGDGKESFVLDISNISNVNDYTGNVLIKGARFVSAVYFNKDQKDNKGDNLYKKIADDINGVIDNVYFGGELAEGESFNIYSGKIKTSDKARTLEEFEYFGNNGTYPDGGTVA